jgi:protoporphyrinogen oxidase
MKCCTLQIKLKSLIGILENMERIKYAILGGGIAGLGAALKLREKKEEYIVFEKNNTTGGLLDNFTIQNFRFDKAVHLSFATEEKVREVFDQTPYITHPSDSFCFDGGIWLKHPIQNNLFKLDPKEKTRLIESYVARPETLEINNYRDWLIHQYGPEIAKKYPIKYTRKYWCKNPEELSIEWVGNRMRRSKHSEVLFGSFSEDTPNDYYTKEMRYPKKGGYKGFIEPLIKETKVKNGYKLIRINLEMKSLYFENGKIIEYENLISTMPLPDIVNCIENIPEEIKLTAQNLVATSMDLVSIGFSRNVINKLWFYIYDEDILASRAHSPSTKSSDNCPAGCSSIQFEIYNLGQKSQYSDEKLFENTIYALKKLGIGLESDILFMDRRSINYANIIFYKGMEADRKIILDYLRKNSITTCGRFGEWDYLWSNQSLLSGYNSIL